MRIAFLVSAFPPRYETFIVNQMIGLLKAGHEVEIFAQHHGPTEHVVTGEYQQELLSTVKYRPAIPKGRRDRFFKAAYLTVRQFARAPRTLLRGFRVAHSTTRAGLSKLVFEAAPFFPRRKFDIIHCQYGHIGCVGVMLRQQGVLTGPIITSFRGFDLTRMVRQQQVDYADLFAEGDLFLPVSEDFRQRLIKIGCPAGRIEVLRSAIDCDRFRSCRSDVEKTDEIRVITVGRLYEKKGIEFAMRAISALNNPMVTYSIIGEGPLEQSLKQLAIDLKIRDQVQFAKWIPPEDIPKLLQQAHIAIHPSITAANGDEEGIPNALKESMASGLPVIATRHSGITELVEHQITGYLVGERDPEAIASCLKRILADRKGSLEIGNKARNFVRQNYHITKIERQLSEAYQRVSLSNTAPR